VVRCTGENKGDEGAILRVGMSLPWDLVCRRGVFCVNFTGTLPKLLISPVDPCGQRGEGGGVYKGINDQRSRHGSKQGGRMNKREHHTEPFILLIDFGRRSSGAHN
jgi:hypothetical protein